MALKRAVGLKVKNRNLFLVSGSLLGQKHGLDVGQNSSLGDGDSREKLVQLLVVSDSQLEMAGVDSGLLVVTGCVSGQLEHFSSQVFQDGSQVDGGSGSDTLGVVSLAKQTVKTTNGELESSSR